MERGASALSRQSVFETGDFSDFVIETATKEFKVHKAIISEKSLVFHVAFTSNFQAWRNIDSGQEAQNGRMVVEEPEEIMEALLRAIYGLKVPWVNRHDIERLQSSDDVARRYSMIEQLAIAVDKYQFENSSLNYEIGHSKDVCTDAWVDGIKKRSWSASPLVKIGCHFYGETFKKEDDRRYGIAYKTAKVTEKVFADEEAWGALRANEKYIKAVMRELGRCGI